MLAEGEFEAAFVVEDFDPAAGEGVVDGLVEGGEVADLADGLQGGGQVGAVVGEDGGAGAHLG